MPSKIRDKPYWWDSLPDELFWMEITARPDIGADLKCPQTNEADNQDPSYGLIRAIWPGDLVFHYSTRSKSVIGASVAGAPLEERPIIWKPHGTAAKSKKDTRYPRSGWWLPLYGFVVASRPLALSQLHNPQEEEWVRNWIEAKHIETGGPVAAPFQRYTGKLRAAQGYLAKMPAEFVGRWAELRELADNLGTVVERLGALTDTYPAINAEVEPTLKLKNDQDYFAVVRQQLQRRSRSHETLVRKAAEYLSSRGADLPTPHPIDLLMKAAQPVIFEAKLIRARNALFAVREAVGQLFEYQHFTGPANAYLCILLSGDPGAALVTYVEDFLRIGICWIVNDVFEAGPKTALELSTRLVQFHSSAATQG